MSQLLFSFFLLLFIFSPSFLLLKPKVDKRRRSPLEKWSHTLLFCRYPPSSSSSSSSLSSLPFLLFSSSSLSSSSVLQGLRTETYKRPEFGKVSLFFSFVRKQLPICLSFFTSVFLSLPVCQFVFLSA